MEPVPSDYYQLELPYKPSSASVYWKKITIPKGLPALLETFVREAIRESPDDIYKFLANLTESLLAKRAAEEQEAESTAGFKKEKQAADEESPLLDSQIPIPTSFKLEDQTEVQSQQQPASKEQVEETISPSVSPTSASPPAVVEQEDASSTTLAEETAAATKIQSQFRGFKTRKELKEQLKQQEEEPKSQQEPESEIKPREKAIGTVVEEKRKESIEPEKQDKPVVKRRLFNRNKQATVKEEESGKEESTTTSSLAAQAEVASSSTTSGPSPSASPILRRNKPGSGRNRSRAATNKYRSGLVIEGGISMDEMEKEIEKEMMNNAATKIQAAFRGFETRRSLVGVRKNGKCNTASPAKIAESPDQSAIPEQCLNTAAAAEATVEAKNDDEKETVAATAPSATAARLSPEPVMGAEAAALSAAILASARGGKPPLSCLRSRSYPGSHEEEHPLLEFDEGDEDLLFHPEPEIDLELDPDYINRAATKIQANFRGYRVRKSFKRPAGKEHNGDKSLLKSQKLAEADKVAEERAKVMETHERLQQRDEEELCPEDFDTPAEPEKAAAKIQASFRSYKERQRFHRKKKAAITIQASIRGFLTRKRLANMRRRSFQRRRSSAKAYLKELEEIRKVNEAATKIQAVFRG
ncbi:unnamed protein product [Orchesella dallaii]|uniref:Abnormal spindle-like microcephaly-associated protein n=1 Tax=Orchesella dallaii TaxID=48710 RepID=A0ABP1PPA0_9HEXA